MWSFSLLCRGVLWSSAKGKRDRGTYHSSFRIGALVFSVLRFKLFLHWFFGFAVHFGLRILRSLAFGFRFSSKIQTGFRNCFRFILDLSGN